MYNGSLERIPRSLATAYYAKQERQRSLALIFLRDFPTNHGKIIDKDNQFEIIMPQYYSTGPWS